LVVVPAQPERKRWWHNLRGGMPVDARLRGRDYHGYGRLVAEREEVERARAL